MYFNAIKHNNSYQTKVHQLWTSMKSLKKKLLFALFADQPGQEFEYHGYSYLYFRAAGFGRGSVRSAVNQLSAAGLVDKLSRNRRVLFRLTGAGREVLLKNTGSKAPAGVWDRRWRLVIVNQIGRDLRPLQRQLSLLGYRRLSRGAYLAAANINRETRGILAQNRWLNQAVLIESRAVVSADAQILARNLWPLEEISKKYDDFITLADRLLKLSRPNLVLLNQAKFGFKAVFDAYFQLFSQDPGLSKVLLPPDWPAEAARNLYFRLAALAKTAKI